MLCGYYNGTYLIINSYPFYEQVVERLNGERSLRVAAISLDSESS